MLPYFFLTETIALHENCPDTEFFLVRKWALFTQYWACIRLTGFTDPLVCK